MYVRRVGIMEAEWAFMKKELDWPSPPYPTVVTEPFRGSMVFSVPARFDFELETRDDNE